MTGRWLLIVLVSLCSALNGCGFKTAPHADEQDDLHSIPFHEKTKDKDDVDTDKPSATRPR